MIIDENGENSSFRVDDSREIVTSLIIAVHQNEWII